MLKLLPTFYSYYQQGPRRAVLGSLKWCLIEDSIYAVCIYKCIYACIYTFSIYVYDLYNCSRMAKSIFKWMSYSSTDIVITSVKQLCLGGRKVRQRKTLYKRDAKQGEVFHRGMMKTLVTSQQSAWVCFLALSICPRVLLS